MVRCGKLWLVMTRKALRTEERHALFRCRREMRVMTASAGHLVPAHALARALSKLLNFAHSSGSHVIPGVDIKGEIVGDRVAGPIVDARNVRHVLQRHLLRGGN